MVTCGSFTLEIKALSPVWQLRLLGIVLLILGVIEYVVGIVENYIIASKSQTDEIVYQYSGNILDIFSQIFIFVNTGFLTMLTVRESSVTDVTVGRRKNVSRVFHFGIAAGLVSGLTVMLVLLLLRVQLFDMLRQRDLADYATTFFSIRAPFVPLEYVSSVISSALLGLMLIKPLLIACLLSNGLYIPVLLLLLNFMDDKVAAIAWANGFQIVTNLAAFIFILRSKSFSDKYEIFDFSAYKSKADKLPLLFDSPSDTPPDTTSLKSMAQASFLLFTKNFFSTLASITGTICLAGVLSTDQFVANNVLSNTIQFTSFASFYNMIINIFGPKLIFTRDYTKFTGLYKKAHINILVLAVGSLLAFFFFHTGNISVKNLTSSSDEADVESLIAPLWAIWWASKILSMYVNLYDTAMVNFQKYHILGLIGLCNAVLISIPMTLISALKYHSLVGLLLAGLVSSAIELGVTGSLFHFKYLKDPRWIRDRPLVEDSMQANRSSILGGDIN